MRKPPSSPTGPLLVASTSTHDHDCLKGALEMVLAWDLPEDELADAANDQARLMAGIPPKEIRPQQGEHYSSTTS